MQHLGRRLFRFFKLNHMEARAQEGGMSQGAELSNGFRIVHFAALDHFCS